MEEVRAHEALGAGLGPLHQCSATVQQPSPGGCEAWICRGCIHKISLSNTVDYLQLDEISVRQLAIVNFAETSVDSGSIGKHLVD